MGITPWPGGEQVKAYMFCRGLVELLKLGSILVGVEECRIFLESQYSQNYCFEVKCVFRPVDWN